MKTNKKMLSILLFSVFLIGAVTAGLVIYQGQFRDTFNAHSPVTVDGLEAEDLGDVSGGGLIIGSSFTLENIEDFSVLMGISNNAEEGISVEYKGTLQLTKKNVDFSADVWDVLEDKVNIEYTLVGEKFTATTDLEGYTLIYYKDQSDRFDSPATAILISEVTGNLPYADDKNVDEYDYCATEEYLTCSGAKIWAVPIEAILTGNELNWSMASEFYFESELIQFSTTGEIVMYPGMNLEFTPEYTIGLNFTDSTTVTNSIINIALA